MPVQTIAEAAMVVRPDYTKVAAGARAAGTKAGNEVAQGMSGPLKRASGDAGKSAGSELGAKFAAASKDKIRRGLSASLGALGIGASIGGAITAGITGALNIGAANDKLRAQLNLTSAESAKLGKLAGKLYADNYGESMEQVNEAISMVVRNVPALRNASVPVLREITAGALDINRVFGQDLEKTTAAVASMLKSGVARNAQEALDVLTKGFQSGANKADDLLDTFIEYPVQFKKLGLDGRASLGVINQLLAGGARNSDLAADAIKEFAIRAIDGSKGTVAAYKTLGLNADLTAEKIAKGGPTAKATFDLIVDRLNAIKDPVKRNTAGVQLFGTKWEDLGGAIRKLDVSKATDGLGKVAGATKTLVAQTDSGRIQGFIRTVQQGFVSIVGGQILPRLKEFIVAHRAAFIDGMARAQAAGRQFLPVLQNIGSFITGRVVPALLALASGTAAVVSWFHQHAAVSKTLGVAILTVVSVVKIYQAAVAVSAAATRAWAAVTKVAAVATSAWNSVFVLRLRLWAIDAAAAARATAATVANTVAQKASAVATTVWTAVTTGASAALAGARFAVLALWTAIRANPVGAVITILTLLVGALIYAYHHSETFRRIVDAAWKGIKAAAEATWNWMKNTLWPSLKKAVEEGKAAFHSFQSAVSGIWRAVTSDISARWNAIKAVLSAMKNFITVTVPDAFRSGVSAISRYWANLQEAARKPVAFVVNTVINPFLAGFQRIAGVFGVKTPAPIRGFAAGGIPGNPDEGLIPGPASSRDNRVGWLRNGSGKVIGNIQVATGEFIVNARDTLKALPLLRWINDGMKGGPDEVVRRLGRPMVPEPGDGSEGWAFAKGGFLGFLGDVWDVISNPAKLIQKPFDAALSKIPGGGLVKDLLFGMGKKLLGGAISFIKGQGGGAGGDIGKAQAFVRAQNGKPYVWASAGPGGYDCSGIVSAVYNILKGRNPYSHTFSTGSLPGSWFDTSKKIGPLTAGWSHPGQRPASASVGHMAGMIGGLPFESRGSRGVIVGPGARRVNEFANIGVARASGGLVDMVKMGKVAKADFGAVTLSPGANLVYNHTGKPEPMETTRPTGGPHDGRMHPDDIKALAEAIGKVLAAALLSTVPMTRVAARQAGRRA